MKKILSTLLLLFSIICVKAQNEIVLDWRQELPQHEVALGIGDPFFTMFDSPRKSHSYPICPISFHYLYRVTKFLWLGGQFSYSGVHSKLYDPQDGTHLGNANIHKLTLLPSIRFSYLNKKYVTLYSGLSSGVVTRFLTGVEMSPDDHYFFFPFRYQKVSVRPAIQATFVGISVGNKWFGFTELGFGMNGLIRAGFGYHFNH